MGQPWTCPQEVWNILSSLSQLTPRLGHQGEDTEAGTYHPLSNVLLKGSFGMQGSPGSQAESREGWLRGSPSLRGGRGAEQALAPSWASLESRCSKELDLFQLLCTWPGKQPTSGETSWAQREPQLPQTTKLSKLENTT